MDARLIWTSTQNFDSDASLHLNFALWYVCLPCMVKLAGDAFDVLYMWTMIVMSDDLII
jgi:hypothetical protein